MNILGFVFSLLLLLTYSFAACWDKQIGATRMRTSYLGHTQTARLLVNQSESTIYKDLPYKKKQKKEGPKKESASSKKSAVMAPNADCARINLWPLLQDGTQSHPQLCDLTCKLLDTFYGSLMPGSSKQFLERFLKSAQKALQVKEPALLEKIYLAKQEDRLIYYHMLKGTKDESGPPPLTDYIMIDPNPAEKICLCHAHPNLLKVLFGPKAGEKLYSTLHQKNPPPVTPELIDNLCGEASEISPNTRGLYDLILFGPPKHTKSSKIALRAEAPFSNISLKSNVFFPEKNKGV